MADLPFGFSSGDDPERDTRKNDPASGSGGAGDPFGMGGAGFDMSQLGQIFSRLGEMFSGAGLLADGRDEPDRVRRQLPCQVVVHRTGPGAVR